MNKLHAENPTTKTMIQALFPREQKSILAWSNVASL
jgi:hypothetical protein